MNVVSIIVFVVLACFVTWLVIDTIIYCVKKIKAKKRAKRGGMRLDCGEEIVNNDTTDD